MDTKVMILTVWPNHSPEPTAFAAAVASHATSRRWLSFWSLGGTERATDLIVHTIMKCIIAILVAIAIIADFSGTVSRATGPIYIPPDVRYYCPGIIIGNAGTNKVMAGVWTMGDQFNFEVKIMAVPSSFQASRALPEYRPDPAFGAFLKPPGKVKFLKVELRGQDGRVLAPVQKLDDSLPSTLPVKAFPQYAQKERHDGNIDFQDRLRRSPSELGDFTIQNAYRIEKEGDYTLTVCCAIYVLPFNGRPPTNVDYDKYQTLSATRVDLPCVTAKIHLAPP